MDNNNYNNDPWQQYPSQQPPQQQYNSLGQPVNQKKNYDVAVLILGIVSAIMSVFSACLCCCMPVPIATAIIGIVLAFITSKNGYEWNPQRIIGLVLCIASIFGLLLYFVYIIIYINSPAGQEAIKQYMDMYQEIMSEYSDFNS